MPRAVSVSRPESTARRSSARLGRLRGSRDFARLFAQGRRLHEKYFTVLVLVRTEESSGPGVRLGLAVPRKALPLAVQRSRWKRQVRESFRLNAHGLPTIDIVLLAKPTPQQELFRLRENLDRVWKRIAAICRESSSS